MGTRFVTAILTLALLLLGLLTGCDLPQVRAEDRLFLDLSLELLDEYLLPKTTFEDTVVGGLSALAYDRRAGQFYALSDDRTQARFYKLNLVLDQSKPEQVKIQDLKITGVTLLKGPDGQPYPSGTIDLEGIALSPLQSVFISSEGGTDGEVMPFIGEFELATGKWRRYLPLPQTYLPDGKGREQQRGIRDNLGFESLTLVSPASTNLEPFRIFAATESALAQDWEPETQEQAAKSRVLHYLAEPQRSLLISEHAYVLDPPTIGTLGHGLTDLLALDQGGHFLSLERSFGLRGFKAKIFQVNTGGATDTSTIPSLKGNLATVRPVYKQLLLDLNQLKLSLDNLEGMALGPRLANGDRTLLLVSDDNFRSSQVTQFLLFRLHS